MPYLGNIPAENYASFDKQTITGDGGASYTLDNPVGSAQEVAIFVNNVRQEPGVAYTVTGTALTMTGNVSASDDFYAIFIGKAVQSVVVPRDENIALDDNIKAVFGTGGDLEIFHNGSNSFIEDVGTGRLVLKTNGTDITLGNSTKNLLKAVADGAVELYHNDVKKAETSSSGFSITGDLTVSDIDGSSALKIKQIVSNNVTTYLEVGSGANPDWTQGATTITPTSNTNPILVIISCFSKSSTSATTGRTNIRRKINSGSYGDVGGELHLYNVNGATVANNSHFSFQRWDNPTRSAGDSLTYTLDLRRVGGSDSVFLIGESNFPANFTLIEFEGTTETNGA